jgi:hypothetical protein
MKRWRISLSPAARKGRHRAQQELFAQRLAELTRTNPKPKT